MKEVIHMKIKKIIIALICSAVVLWISVGIIDYIRVHSFKKPIFCVAAYTYDDGGSGKYVGPGYSFDIEGNFLPTVDEEELYGVTKWTYRLFGIELQTQMRN